MHRTHLAAFVFVASVTLALAGCSASKKSSTAATTAGTTYLSAQPSATTRADYLAAIAPVDKLRDEYEASKGTPARTTIAPQFAASLRTFDAVVAKWPTTGRTETDLQTMISDDQLVATEVTANNLTVASVNRDDAAHAVVRADLGLPPA